MANGPIKKDASTSKPSDGKLRDSELIGWLVGFLFFAIIAGAVLNTLGGLVHFESGMGIGAVVSADGDIEVWEEPDAGDLLGIQLHGAEGEVTQGPVEVSGDEWWYVDFEQEPDGWVDEDDLRVEKAALQIGDIVEMVRDANVWDQAGGGISQGLQRTSSLGELTGGPVVFGLEEDRWWEVDFDDGPDGWVRASDIQRGPSTLARWWRQFMDVIFIPSIALSVLLVVGIAILTTRIRNIATALREKYQTPETAAFVRSKEERAQEDVRWKRVQELVHSPEPANWRLAILEADIMLNDIVSRMGYDGETLGERLKQVEKSDFLTLDDAWEAHKVRNTIAHEGGDFILTQREARRVIGLYENVFKEFHFI